MALREFLLAALAATTFQAAASDRIRIADEGSIRDQWTLASGTQLAAPAYPAEYAAEPEQVCVAIGYLLGADGHTSDFALLKSWSSGDQSGANTRFWGAFAGAASQALAQWHFTPKEGVGTPSPVYTVATFVFGPPGATGVRERCAVGNLTNRLLELRYDDRAGRRMSRGIFSRLDIDPNVEERFRQARLMRHEDRTRERMPALPPPSSTTPPPPPSQGR